MVLLMGTQQAQPSTQDPLQDDRQFSAADLDFFENKVRPILVDHCLSCHGDDETKLRGGLYLTSRSQMIAGGDSGPAIVPGKPAESLLISAIEFNDFEMPPKGQLDNSDIEILKKWIQLGAPDPRNAQSRGSLNRSIDIEAGKQFWAFQPRRAPEPPQTRETRWPESDIDRFILARLENERLAPVADASRETLIRRAYIALIGLPPTPDQIDAFENSPDDTPTVFGKLVDDLLQSPHYGERWGRHWLDVVRFAESSGGGRSLMFPDAWRFRDYVINAYNADKPFDMFVREQIAGDLLPYDSHDQKIEQIVATGMLALGPTNYEQQDKELLRMEVVDEQVDTAGRAFLGLTLGCARCHDHKFDPIPMTDYYALAGIFGSTRSLVDGNVSKYVERSLATESELATESRYRGKVNRLSRELAQAKIQLKELGGEVASNQTAKKNRPSQHMAGIVMDDRSAALTGDWTESTSTPFFVDGHYLHDNDADKGKKQVVFSPNLKTGGLYEVRLSYSPGGNRASNVPVRIDHQDGQENVIVNQSEPPPIEGLFISLGQFRFEADNKSSITISNTDTDGHVIVDAVQFLLQDSARKESTNPSREPSGKLAEQAHSAGRSSLASPASVEVEEVRQNIKRLEEELRTLKKNAPRRTAFAMSVKDAENPVDGHLHIRGSVRNLGPVVPRGFISVCSPGPVRPKLGKQESGRLQLANWIASPNHPLTARVYVNRVWRHLFGVGLVSTTENFGLMGERPSHPALLDHLANRFVSHGWSTKRLIREIMLSHVYRLRVDIRNEATNRDPTNRLLSRANRRRVDAEVLRDSILFVSGELDLTPGGRTIRKITQYDLGYEFDTVRRSVYVPAFRNSMLDAFEVFDFANPNLVTGHRNTSTLPTQALFLMNNPMVIQQSENFASRLLARQELDNAQRIELAYRQALGRRPTKQERDQTLEYLKTLTAMSQSEDPELAAWSSVCHAIFASLEFRYID